MPTLAQGHTVIAVDLRGAGDSDCPAAGYDKKNDGGGHSRTGAAARLSAD